MYEPPLDPGAGGGGSPGGEEEEGGNGCEDHQNVKKTTCKNSIKPPLNCLLFIIGVFDNVFLLFGVQIYYL